MNTEINGKKRRDILINLIKNSDKPISGTTLGKETGVSRQVVVQDIALLRTEGYPIISTARGYIFSGDTSSDYPTRIIKVCHTNDQVEDELKTIVDLGGCVVNVMVNHRMYGKVSAPLNIKSRRDINNFIEDIKTSKSTPLSNITSGYHFHTISAESEQILDEIENELQKKNYIVELMDYESID